MKKAFALLFAALSMALTASAQYADLYELGTPAPNFTAADTLGVDHSLSDFADRLVVVDFWASWCGDCRREMPALKQLHADYSPLGIEFVSVSFDENKDAWVNYLRKQQLGWLQLSNLLPWHSKVDGVSVTTNPIAADYSLQWIPTILLIDHGNIAAFDITVERFEAKLKAYLEQ